MTRIKRIQTFLDDYNLLKNSQLKSLLKYSQEYYQKELSNKYLKVSK